jgi:hypothetical protein
VPDVDYIPLFALLGSQLTDSEVHEIGEELAKESDPAKAGAIRDAITAVTHHQANDADVARVRSRLAAGGWLLTSQVLGQGAGAGDGLPLGSQHAREPYRRLVAPPLRRLLARVRCRS